jgi:hypothetical protein
MKCPSPNPFYGFHSTHDESNAAGSIINHRTRYNSLCRDKKERQITSYVMVYKAVSYESQPHVHDLSLTSTSVA